MNTKYVCLILLCDEKNSIFTYWVNFLLIMIRHNVGFCKTEPLFIPPSIFHLFVCLFVSLFVCLDYFIPVDNFSLLWRRPHCRWRAVNFDLCSALMAIEQWGFFSMSHLLLHGVSVHIGHFRAPVPLTPIAEPLAMQLMI